MIGRRERDGRGYVEANYHILNLANMWFAEEHFADETIKDDDLIKNFWEVTQIFAALFSNALISFTFIFSPNPQTTFI